MTTEIDQVLTVGDFVTVAKKDLVGYNRLAEIVSIDESVDESIGYRFLIHFWSSKPHFFQGARFWFSKRFLRKLTEAEAVLWRLRE